MANTQHSEGRTESKKAPQQHSEETGGQFSMAATSAKETAMEYGYHYVTEPAKDLIGLLQDYAKSRPDVAAVWCFGLGLLLGWKLRP